MRTLRYLTLLGLFASAGVALAVGLAVSTLPPGGSPPPAEKVIGGVACMQDRSAPSPQPSPARGEGVSVAQPSRPSAEGVSVAQPSRPRAEGGCLSAGAKASMARQVPITRLPAVAPLVPGVEEPIASGQRDAGKSLVVAAPLRPASGQEQRNTELGESPVLELKVVGEPVKSSPSEPAAPPALVALPDPPIAQQIPGKDAREAFQKIYKNLVGPLTGAPPAAVPEVIPPPPPEARPNTEKAAPAPAASQGPAIQVDQKGAEGDGRLRIQFPETDVREVLDSLGEYGNLNILTSKTVQGKISVRMRNVSVNDALDAVVKQAGYVSKREGNFVYVGNPQEIDAMQQTYGQIKTRVYRPNYVSSTELESLIKPMLTDKIGVITKFAATQTQGGSGSGGGGGGGGGGSGSGSGSSSSGVEGGDGYAGGEVVVVRDYEAVLAQVDELVAQVDVRPMQVAIEAMILAVKLADSDKLGVNFEVLSKQHPELALNVGTPAALQPSVQGSGALSLALTDGNLSAFLDALQETNDTNVIATPRLMVMNKQRAEIHIGNEDGYPGSTTQNGTTSTTSVVMLQTGTALRLRPFLSSDGLIRMDVHPELSSGSVDGTTFLPHKETTEVTTNIMVRDGCTVIIGGLMREQLTKDVSQVAGLGSLPVVGALFRSTVETTERQEILVLITPHIVYEPETCREGEQGASEFHRRQALVAEKMCPLGKRSLGRRYLRLAQNAWAAGDRDTAIRYAELAVHFDPQNRAAIDLRSNIWQGQPCGKHSLQQAPRDPGANPLDGPEIAGWLMDDLEREPMVQPAPEHPLDPGRPGRHRDIVRPRVAQ